MKYSTGGKALFLDFWKDQPPGYYVISSKSREGTWKDHFFESIPEAKVFVERQKKKELDLYFCTTTLKKPKRVKENVLPSVYLWQDLDESNPDNLPQKLRPTIAWQSSPNRYQALWQLDSQYPPDQIESLNKSLAKVTKADRGSWILTKVLRIPGTTNFKYPKKPTVKMLWSDGPSYQYKTLLKNTKSIPESINDESIAKPIPAKVKKLLYETKPTIGRRSDVLWYIEHELMKSGFTTKEIYKIIKGSVWNKYKGRRDEEERITEEIAKIFEEEVLVPESAVENIEDDDEDTDKPNLTELILENDIDLMTNMSHYPGWLIEGFWTRKSHGIIAGEPKSFKSVLSLDLALSVASGQPFLNQFEVHESGPVLIVQNENASWIMKDRLNKIRNHKGLTGSIDRVSDHLYKVKFPATLPIYYLNQQGFSFDNDFHKEILIKIIRQIKPVLIIFDPLYLMFAGDLNTSKDLNPILTWLLNLKNRFDCALVVVHHWKKSTQKVTRGGQRLLGSTTLHGWVESAWYLEVKETVETEAGEKKKMDDIEVIKSPSADTKLILEREFRGAGTYPKMDLQIHMGEFNTPDYSVKIEKHTGRGKRTTTATKEEIEMDIQNYLDLKKGKKIPSNREIARELGISRRLVEEAMENIKTIKDKKG